MTIVPASRFGQDAPARIQHTTGMLMEATSVLPEQAPVPLSIPFYAGQVISGDEAAAAALALAQPPGPQTWERQPERLDLSFRQGDDVLIPLYLQDPENPDLDMSTWEWHAQIRSLPYYTRTLINEFTTDADFLLAPLYHPTLSTTLVKLFLPRELNDFRGTFAWEMYSIGPYSFAEFPQPVDWDVDNDGPWPPVTGLRTWLYGVCTITGRTTDTDVLPDVTPGEIPPGVYGTNITADGFFVGPNGRVP